MGDEQLEGVVRHNWAPERFAQVPNGILYDDWSSGLSYRAKGLYATLAGFQPGRRVTVRYLCVLASDGRDGVLSAVSELKRVGLLRIAKVRDEAGKVVGSRWTIYQDPGSAPPESENPTMAPADWRGDRPESDPPTPANPQQLRLGDQLKREDKPQQHGDELERDFVHNWNLLAVPYLPGVGPCNRLTRDQRRKLEKLAADPYWRSNWVGALNRVRTSAFLCGAVATERSPNGYVLTLSLALSEKFVPNVLQGVYHRDGNLEPNERTQGDPIL